MGFSLVLLLASSNARGAIVFVLLVFNYNRGRPHAHIDQHVYHAIRTCQSQPTGYGEDRDLGKVILH